MKKFFLCILVLALCANLCSAPAAAVETTVETVEKAVETVEETTLEVTIPPVVETTAETVVETTGETVPATVPLDDPVFDTVLTGGGSLDSGSYFLSENLFLLRDITITGTVKLCLNGFTLMGTGLGPVITVEEGGRLILSDGQGDFGCISGGSGGIAVKGTLLFHSGTICDNTARQGGGLYIDGGSVTMDGGCIRRNSAGVGGGVCLQGGDFTLLGGSIDGNLAYLGDGGGVYADGAVVTLNGGSVCDNTAMGSGGGVYACAGSVRMVGGTLRGNHAGSSGGGLYLDEDSRGFLSGGSIGSNRAELGGGLFVDSLLSVSGGTVFANHANLGGGFALGDGGIVTLSSGTIQGNLATMGGGIFCGETGKLFLFGGEIRDNAASSQGGGIFMSDSQGCLLLGGTPFVMENSDGDGDGNLSLPQGGVLTLGRELSQEARVGISLQCPLVEDVIILDGEGDFLGCLFSDDGYLCMDTPDGMALTRPTDLQGAQVVLGDTLVFNGLSQVQTVESVTLDGQELAQGVDYTVSGAQASLVGECTLTVDGIGNYCGQLTVPFTVAPADLQGCAVTLGEPLGYNGETQVQEILSVTMNGLSLEEGVDYRVSGSSGIHPGDYTLVVKGCGNYCGEAAIPFTIAAKSISGAEVTLGNRLCYTGSVQNQSVSSVILQGKPLVPGVDYTISGTSGVAAGDYHLEITGIGFFSGTLRKEFSIAAKDLSRAAVSLGEDGTVLSVVLGNGLLSPDKDYCVEDALVQGIGNYCGSIDTAAVGN